MDYPPVETRPRFSGKADFLVWEEEQETRFEFDGEEVTEVTGGTLNHILIMTNLVFALRQRLRGTSFLVWSQAKVETGPGYRYPDIAVGPRDADGTKTVLPQPVALFEVLSPSTASVDFGRKRAEYGDLASVQQYVLIESRSIGARVLTRQAAGASSELVLEGADAVLPLAAIGASLLLADCYEDVRF